MENVKKGSYYSWYQINIWNANANTFTDHTNCHIHENSYYKNPYHCSLRSKNPSPGATWSVMLEKIWILIYCVEGKSYQGTTEIDTLNGLLSRI